MTGFKTTGEKHSHTKLEQKLVTQPLQAIPSTVYIPSTKEISISCWKRQIVAGCLLFGKGDSKNGAFVNYKQRKKEVFIVYKHLKENLQFVS